MDTPITDGFRDIFLAGVGALAMTGEKTKEVLEELIARGQISVEQGRKINEELSRRGAEKASELHTESIRAFVKALPADERKKLMEELGKVAEEADAEAGEPADEEAETAGASE